MPRTVPLAGPAATWRSALAGRVLDDLARGLTYGRIAYLLLAFPLGTAYFAVLVTAISIGLGLAITFAGLPILAGAMWAWRGMAQLERRLAWHLLGVAIAAPYREPERPGLWVALRTRLADPATWKDLVYLLLAFPLGIASFTLAVALLGGSLALLLAPILVAIVPDGFDLGFVRIDTLPEAILAVPAGALALVASLELLNGVGALWGSFARVLLGSSPDPELSARVVDLRTSRARIIAAADAERRRLERNLHDGAQQRLVALSMSLGMAEQRLARGEDASALVGAASDEARRALDELRDLARGIHPAILTNLGLAAALEELAGRSAVPVELAATPAQRLPEPVEAAAYFVVSEALVNVAKYAEATQATVVARVQDGELVVEVADDGRGGADPAAGSGLRGLADRVSALDGQLDVDSPAGGGTRVRAAIPTAPVLEDAPGAAAPLALGPELPEPDAAALVRDRRQRQAETHAIVFGVVMTVLVLIWAVTGFGYFWPVWPLLGWGAVVALHAALARRPPPIAVRDRERGGATGAR